MISLTWMGQLVTTPFPVAWAALMAALWVVGTLAFLAYRLLQSLFGVRTPDQLFLEALELASYRDAQRLEHFALRYRLTQKAWLALLSVTLEKRGTARYQAALSRAAAVPELKMWTAQKQAEEHLEAGDTTTGFNLLKALSYQKNPNTYLIEKLLPLALQLGDLELAHTLLVSARKRDLLLSQVPNWEANLLMNKAKGPNTTLKQQCFFLEKAVSLAPENVRAMVALATVYLQRNTPQKATDLLKVGWHMNPDARLIPLMLTCHEKCTPTERLENIRSMVANAATHPLSILLVGTLALKASFWSIVRENIARLRPLNSVWAAYLEAWLKEARSEKGSEALLRKGLYALDKELHLLATHCFDTPCVDSGSSLHTPLDASTTSKTL